MSSPFERATQTLPRRRGERSDVVEDARGAVREIRAAVALGATGALKDRATAPASFLRGARRPQRETGSDPRGRAR